MADLEGGATGARLLLLRLGKYTEKYPTVGNFQFLGGVCTIGSEGVRTSYIAVMWGDQLVEGSHLYSNFVRH